MFEFVIGDLNWKSRVIYAARKISGQFIYITYKYYIFKN